MRKVNIAEKFSKITEYWKPYIAAELNGQAVKLDKLKGEFVFHHHEHEDEMFLVVKGRFRMHFRDKDLREHHELDRGRRIHRRPARSRTQASRRRGMLAPAVRTRFDPEHRQRRQRAHPAQLERV